MKPEKLENPLNSMERYLHAIAVRLDIVIEQNNSIIEHIAKQDKVAVTEHKTVTAEDKPAPRKRTAQKKVK